MQTNNAKPLDGKALANKIHDQLSGIIAQTQAKIGRPPGLAVLMVGDNPASAAYVGNKERACTQVGIASFGKHFPTETSQTELEAVIAQLNEDERVDGILVPRGRLKLIAATYHFQSSLTYHIQMHHSRSSILI